MFDILVFLNDEKSVVDYVDDFQCLISGFEQVHLEVGVVNLFIFFILEKVFAFYVSVR